MEKDEFPQSSLQTIRFFEEFIRKEGVVKFIREYLATFEVDITTSLHSQVCRGVVGKGWELEKAMF